MKLYSGQGTNLRARIRSMSELCGGGAAASQPPSQRATNLRSLIHAPLRYKGSSIVFFLKRYSHPPSSNLALSTLHSCVTPLESVWRTASPSENSCGGLRWISLAVEIAR